ncbi:MAG: hypothetical protein WKF84_17020 [Pyrinomonadaceae bacterium]
MILALSGGEAYIIMELVDGQTLREYIDAFDQFRISEAVSITEQVANGIGAASSAGHHPSRSQSSNIILDFGSADAQLVAKVVDFGIAQLKEQSRLQTIVR